MFADHQDSSSENQGRRSRRPTIIDETYARYERSPFRKYSLKPSEGTQTAILRQKSKNSLLNRFSSVRSKMGSSFQGAPNRTKSSQRPKPAYSLAGPSAYQQQDEDGDDYNSDEGFGRYGRRPQPTIGLGKPFQRQKRGGRWRKRDSVKNPKRAMKEKSESGKPEGQVRIIQ